MRLIDILNMISKGELKEGTKIKIGREIYSWNTGFLNNAFEGEDDTYLDPMQCLSVEVELIEPDHFTDIGKMAEKIEELDVDSFYDDIKGYETLDCESAVLGITDKLNEVIRRINNERL